MATDSGISKMVSVGQATFTNNGNVPRKFGFQAGQDKGEVWSNQDFGFSVSWDVLKDTFIARTNTNIFPKSPQKSSHRLPQHHRPSGLCGVHHVRFGSLVNGCSGCEKKREVEEFST